MRKMVFTIMIWFQENDKGERHTLESMKLTTKPMTLAGAQKLAIKEAKACWPDFEIEINGEPVTT